MKFFIIAITTSIFFAACQNATQQSTSDQTKLPIEGTWKLISGTLIEKNDTTVTHYGNDTSFIKIINGDHFAFLSHDIKGGKDSATAFFSCGGGAYDLKDSNYTEHLEYCNDRQWENHDFSFTITIKNDTLTQQGLEKIDSLGVNRINIERYARMK